MNFNEKMYRLIDAVKEGSLEGLQRNKDKIDAIALECKEKQLYVKNEAQTRDFAKDMIASETYNYMILKIANAPFQIMAHGVAIMFMSVVAEKLDAETTKSLSAKKQ